MKKTITRHTILGWGWTANCTKGNCVMPDIDYTGTIKQLKENIEGDELYVISRKGTVLRSQFFLGGIPIVESVNFHEFVIMDSVKVEIELGKE